MNANLVVPPQQETLNNPGQLWMNDGTLTGTKIVSDINPRPNDSIPSFPFDLVYAGGTLFFNVEDGTNGRELWALEVSRQTYLPLILKQD